MQSFFYIFVMNTRVCRHLCLAGLGLLLAACQTTPSDTKPLQVQDPMDRASIVTMGSPKLDRSKPSSLSWAGQVEVVGDVPDRERLRLQQLVQTLCEQGSERKGYPVTGDGDFQLLAIIVMEAGEDTSALLLGSAGIDPGIAGSKQAHGKGALVLELRQGRTVRWRGAVQIYTDTALDETLRDQRLAHAVAQLLSTWP